MKLKKTIMSIFALAATGLIITPIATSCSDVSSDIIDNLVDKGENADKFSSVGEKGDNKTSLEQYLKCCLHFLLITFRSTYI